jgi:hypothetical protein
MRYRIAKYDLTTAAGAPGFTRGSTSAAKARPLTRALAMAKSALGDLERGKK